MNKIVLFLILIMTCNLLNAQEHIEYYENGNIKKTGQYGEDGYATGIWKEYYENGNIKNKGEHKQGRSIGLVSFYHENGRLNFTYNYTTYERTTYYDNEKTESKGKEIRTENDGKFARSGKWKMYYKNGVLESEGEYSGEYTDSDLGVKIGQWKEYHESGKIKMIGNYSKGEMHGEYKFYYENGQLSNKGTYNNYNNIGESLSYYENGTLRRKEFYNSDSQLEGESNTYYENGKLEINIKALGIGKFHAKMYNKNGDLTRETTTTSSIEDIYYYNQKNGFFKDYNTDGTLKESYHIDNEKLDGEYLMYYKNGIITLKIIFSEGMFWTILEQNDINGNPLELGTLKDGNGSMNYYDENGKLAQKINYINGIAQE